MAQFHVKEQLKYRTRMIHTQNENYSLIASLVSDFHS